MGEHLETPGFMAYYGLLQMQARTFEPIARELEARTGLPASWYELLACLEADADGKRMNELAESLLISRGGATKLVARLEEAGLVERITPKHDRRATFARLTAGGKAAVQAAHPVQLALVDEYFSRFLEPAELEMLTKIACKTLIGLGEECDWVGSFTQAGEAETESAAAPA